MPTLVQGVGMCVSIMVAFIDERCGGVPRSRVPCGRELADERDESSCYLIE
jgi:hypothetical protein